MIPVFAGISAVIAAAAAFVTASGVGGLSPVLNPAAAPKRLSGALTEISGLAPASASSVYAHNDEQATIYEIDIRSGAVRGYVSLGRPPLTGDFEAVLAREGAVALVTSGGLVFEARTGPRRGPLRYKMFDTGLGGVCEVEGAADADGGYLLACKRSKRRLVIYKWSKASGAAKIVDMKLARAVPNPDEFRAADLVSDKKTGTLLVLDSAAGAILELSMRGEPAGYWRLGGNHPQAEGLALLANGDILVADEGEAGLGGGSLTLYPPRR